MKTRDFHYNLPPERIASHPARPRHSSRLLDLAPEGGITDRTMAAFPALVDDDDLLVFNNTRVIPARLYGQKASGGKVEVLIERVLDERRALAHLRSSKSYIERADEQADRDDYQTLYARHPGAVAAPTAGLHFDRELLDALAARNIRTAYVTLHVGAGTFQPVRVENLEGHIMHAEQVTVDASVCEAVEQTRARGGRVIAIGTTVVRSLESAVQAGVLKPFSGDTRLFITPGYRFTAVDALLTNFHLPESTLLMLVCAFSGFEPVMAAYRHAVGQKYRFFSYGDAMFLRHRPVE